MRSPTLPFVISMILLLASCAGGDKEPAENALLPGRLIVLSNLRLPRTADYAPVTEYNKLLLQKALKKEIRIYGGVARQQDLRGLKPMAPEGLAASLGIPSLEPGEDYREEINRAAGEIMSGFLAEEWHLDAERLVFTKKVINYQPVMYTAVTYMDPVTGEEKNSGDTLRALLCSVHTDEPADPFSLPASSRYKPMVKNLSYEFRLYNEAYQDFLLAPRPEEVSGTDMDAWLAHNFIYFRDFNRERFIGILLDKVFSNQVTAYDAGDPDRPLTLAEAYEAMDADSLFIATRGKDGLPHREFIEMIIPVEHIHSVIFIEDWYYNEETMMPAKVVKGIIPVLHRTVYGPEGESVATEKKRVFILFFNQ